MKSAGVGDRKGGNWRLFVDTVGQLGGAWGANSGFPRGKPSQVPQLKEGRGT